MSPGRRPPASSLPLAVAAALTTWVSMLSWGGISEASSRFLGPLLLLGAVVAGTGALARRWRWPAVAVLGTQMVTSALVAFLLLTGSPLPIGPAGPELVRVFEGAVDSANTYLAPVPAGAPSVAPLLVAGGLPCLLLVDLLACTLRRVSLAGLPLLAVHSVPLGLLPDGLPWWVFTASAAGFLGMLFLAEREEVARWGHPVGPAGVEDRIRAGAGRTSAGVIGGTATALAVVVPLAIPTLDLHVFDLGRGSGGSSQIDLENPMTDMRRDLKRGEDRPLVRVRTDDPRPSYLRIAVLNRFSANEWTSGDRDIPVDQAAAGAMPELEGVATGLPRRQFDYTVDVTDEFASSWLPTQAPISAIEARGDWRYDRATMDFIAGEDSLDTAGMSYRMTAVELDRDPAAMRAAPAGGGEVSQAFVDLPPSTPGMVRELAMSVTGAAQTRFEKAVALQDWFREDGGFTYDLAVDLGNGSDDLVEFLSPSGRRGYCEQFASAMAVMARTLGIPARVAVGFLSPQRIAPRTYEYSSWDLHSWPELFIPGSGWTPFEPTPPGRASSVPDYTRIDVGAGADLPVPSASASEDDGRRDRAAEESAAAEPEADRGDEDGDFAGSALPWRWLGGGAGLVVLAALLLVPRTVRHARRERRLAGDAEDVWLELRDTVRDLDLGWPEGRSPRETRGRLVSLGAPADEVAVVVGTLEQERYARPGSADRVSVRTAAQACLTALHAAASRSAQRRADWWPRSVFDPRAAARRGRGRDEGRVESTPGGVVDHVG